MPSSDDSSSSSCKIIDADDIDSGATPATRSGPVAEGYGSTLRTQRAVDTLCRAHGVPAGYTATLAGERRACTPPPEGAVCVYEHALEAGMRLPLHGFFSSVLTHFGIAPGQLSPNAWRTLLGFLVLCHRTGVPPSLAVFRRFFSLVKFRGWHCFRGKDGVGALFTGLPKPNKRWRQRFFFLTSPDPWQCPVRWGEPPSLPDLMLTSQQNKTVAKLLGAQGIPVDLQTYLCETNVAAAFSSSLAEQGTTDQSAKKVKTEPGGDKTDLSGKKRNRDEANSNDGLYRSELSSMPAEAEHRRQNKSVEKLRGAHLPAADLSTRFSETNLAAATPPQSQRSICSSGCKGMDQEAEPNGSTPPLSLSGKKRKQQDEANSKDGVSPSEDTHEHDVDSTGRDAARRELELLQTVNNMSSIAVELKQKLAAKDAELKKARDELEKKDAEVVALREQLKQGKVTNA